MNEDPYAIALKNALTEIKNACPEIIHSFIFTKDGTLVARVSETDEKTMEQMISSFQSVAEKADTLGSLKAFYVNGKKGKLMLSIVNDMYLALATSKNADTTYLHSLTHVIIPTILKLLKTFIPTPLESTPSKQLVVDTLSGFFVGDSVQIDTKTLEEWTKFFNQESVESVDIEAFGGKAAQCKVKEINDPKLKGKGMIRIPEKICKTLEVEKGELVKVKPIPT